MDIGENCSVKGAYDARLSHHPEVHEGVGRKGKVKKYANFKVKVAYCGEYVLYLSLVALGVVSILSDLILSF